MTHLHNVQRFGIGGRSVDPGIVPPVVADAIEQATGPETSTRPRLTTVHAVACDCQMCDSLTHQSISIDGTVERHPCSHETHNQPIPDHEWYVPLGWGIYPDGTHKCPDCRTKAAVERDIKDQQQMVRDLEKTHGEGCVNCGKTWDEHHHPDQKHPEACDLHVHGRQLARPLYKIRQHAHGLKDWSADVGHLGIAFGSTSQATEDR